MDGQDVWRPRPTRLGTPEANRQMPDSGGGTRLTFPPHSIRTLPLQGLACSTACLLSSLPAVPSSRGCRAPICCLVRSVSPSRSPLHLILQPALPVRRSFRRPPSAVRRHAGSSPPHHLLTERFPGVVWPWLVRPAPAVHRGSGDQPPRGPEVTGSPSKLFRCLLPSVAFGVGHPI